MVRGDGREEICARAGTAGAASGARTSEDPAENISEVVSEETMMKLGALGPAIFASAGCVGSWIFSAYASSLDEPTEQDTRKYRQWYRFVHSLAGNLDKVKATKPGGEAK
jgi:hypothetical protein